MSPLRRIRARAALRSTDGFTVIEIMVVTAVLGIVAAMLTTFLTQAQTNLQKQISRSSSNDQVRLAAQSIDREIRSGNVFYDPSTENYSAGDIAPGMSLRVYSQTNAPTRPGSRCIQWRITSAGQLQRRSWAVDWPSSGIVSGWQTVATGLRNRADGVTAFARPQTNLVSMDLRANDDATGKKGATVRVQQMVSGRDTLFNWTQFLCGPVTPDPGQTSSTGYKVPAY